MNQIFIADVIDTIMASITAKAQVLAPGIVVLAIMWLGWNFIKYRRGHEVNVGGVILGSVLLLGAASLAAKYFTFN